jgi:hypothetical protein
VKYCQPLGKIRRYGYVGFSVSYLLADNGDVEVRNRDSGLQVGEDAEDLIEFPKTISNVDLIQNRERLNGALFIGGGLKYKYKLDYFYVDLRYSFGIKNLVNVTNRYSSVTEGLPYPYVDDDFRIDNLAVSIGYIRPLYKPRKLKKARTKSVLRKIKEEDNASN